ncbi:MAG: uL22 family ribosomal protein, partial [Bacteroidota bacterium]
LEEANLTIKAIWVDSAGMLKRIKPAPQGRAHRIKKRASHITLVLDQKYNAIDEVVSTAVASDQTEKNTDGAKS